MQTVAPDKQMNQYMIELQKQFQAEGLFTRTYLFYLASFLIPVLIIAALAYALTLSWVGSSAIIVVIIALLAAAPKILVSYLAHDLGHNQVFWKPKHNHWGMIDVQLFVGFSPSWWKKTHNDHHRHPNSVELDPNYRVPVLAFSKSQLAQKSGLTKWTSRHQAVLYPFLILFQPWSMYIISVKHLMKYKSYRYQELTALGVFLVSHMGFLTWALGLPLALLFFAIHVAAYGAILGLVFASNHKGMRVIEEGESLSGLEYQLTTTRNVRPNLITNVSMGGLNLQIEHHIGCHIPRPHLMKARAIVISFCRERGLPYYETSIWTAYCEVFRFFGTAGNEKVPTFVVENTAVKTA